MGTAGVTELTSPGGVGSSVTSSSSSSINGGIIQLTCYKKFLYY